MMPTATFSALPVPRCSAAALAQHLYVVWAMEAKKMDKEARPFLPHKLVSNLTRLESISVGETMKEKQEGSNGAM